MAASSGIWDSGNALASQPGQAATGSSGASGSSSATISANDFLTLLVTEMQNQDPTATTDPNEYINQLVNVNSLEQLISINQTLQSATGSSSTTTGASGPTQTTELGNTPPHSTSSGAQAGPDSAKYLGGDITHHSNGPAVGSGPGNLGIPKTTPAATRVAQALQHR